MSPQPQLAVLGLGIIALLLCPIHKRKPTLQHGVEAIKCWADLLQFWHRGKVRSGRPPPVAHTLNVFAVGL